MTARVMTSAGLISARELKQTSYLALEVTCKFCVYVSQF
jgi:hypothetical protein